MDAITVRCKMCKHAMRFSVEKAGKRAKCPKCDAIVQIPSEAIAEAKEEPAPVVAAAPAAPAAQAAEGEDDGPAAYDVFLDPELEERRKALQAEEEAKQKRKDKKKLPTVARKVKAIADAESWQKVRIGLLFTYVGTWIWLATHLVQGTYVLLGANEFSEYSALIATDLELRGADFPERLDFWDVDQLNILLGMISGKEFLGYAWACLTIATCLYFLQAFLWMGGLGLCTPVPRRYGTFGQVIAGLVLGFINFTAMFVLKFLPVIGATSYVMIPYVTPEIALTEYNMERVVPIQNIWSGAPFWETFFCIILQLAFYLQPAFGCIFIWSTGTLIKDENLEAQAKGMTQLCLGTFFALLCYHMLSVCGASAVLVMVLRFIYGLWFFFSVVFIFKYAGLIAQCRAVLYDKINPKHELVE